jgi:hypothetical protein
LSMETTKTEALSSSEEAITTRVVTGGTYDEAHSTHAPSSVSVSKALTKQSPTSAETVKITHALTSIGTTTSNDISVDTRTLKHFVFDRVYQMLLLRLNDIKHLSFAGICLTCRSRSWKIIFPLVRSYLKMPYFPNWHIWVMLYFGRFRDHKISRVSRMKYLFRLNKIFYTYYERNFTNASFLRISWISSSEILSPQKVSPLRYINSWDEITTGKSDSVSKCRCCYGYFLF